IAVPGGFQGAMENWGAITYNDQALLVNPSSTLANRQNVFSIQAHEMAHQWNGDLVTMGWWDDIWLNESFASWMAAKETDRRNPSWNWWENQDAAKEGAMDADARVTSHPIEIHVTDELQAENSFDPLITYSKGQAFLRMLEAYLTPDTFRDGIRRYMKARAFSNATSADLWKWLSAASGRDVAAVAASWTQQPGFPLVSVAATCDAAGKRTIALTQKRFLREGTDPNKARWKVPMEIRSGSGGPQRVLFIREGQTVRAGSCAQPLSANAGAIGYYRVAYDDPTAALNAKTFSQLPNGDRIALLDDTWALASAAQAPLPSYLVLSSSMGTNADARAWTQIAGALGTIELAERGTSGYDAFTAYARGVLKPLADRLGWNPKPGEGADTLQLRRTVLGDLGAWDDTTVAAEARRRFAAFVRDRSAIAPDDQATVLGVVAVNADSATFDQLHAIAKSSKNETEIRRYYPALMNVRDPQLAQQAAAIALGPEIPQQAAALRVRLIAGLGNYQPQLSWNTFKAHADTLLAPLGTFAPIFLAEFIPAGAWNAAPLDEIEAFVKSKIPAEMAPNLARGMESARFSLKQKTLLDAAADQFVAQRAAR
ncbi:MAG: M1 family metallopeptidase, partial [Candidatus Velthaea sp.]